MNSTKKPRKRNNVFTFRWFLYDFVKVTGAIPMALYMRPKVHYIENKKELKKIKGMLVMSNHIGFLDPVMVHFALPWRRLWFLATSELFNTKLKRWFFKHINCIEVNKQDVSFSLYKDAVKYLKMDKAVTIFPEGQINHSENDFEKFKLGIAFMSIMNKVPIVPIYQVKREKGFHRSHCVVGEPINLFEQCSTIPTIPEIEKASKFLLTKEQELKKYYEENLQKRKGDKK